jgi:hypothetical protein
MPPSRRSAQRLFGRGLAQFHRARAVLLDVAVAEEQHAALAVADLLQHLAVDLDRAQAIRIAPVLGRGRRLVEVRVAVASDVVARGGQQAEHDETHHCGDEARGHRGVLGLARVAFDETVGQPREHEGGDQHQRPDTVGGQLAFQDARVRQQRPVPQVQRIADEPDPHHRPGREHVAVQHAGRPGGDAEEGAQRRQDRPETREGLAAADRAQAQNDQRQPGD